MLPFFTAVVGCVKRAFARNVCAKVRSEIILATRQSETARATHHLGPCCKSKLCERTTQMTYREMACCEVRLWAGKVIDVDK